MKKRRFRIVTTSLRIRGRSPNGLCRGRVLFPGDTTYFDPGKATFMINYRVENLDALLAQLREEGVQVDDRVEDLEYGRFGWIVDPEGNRIELWEPAPEN
jgi:catechol 2,3-dioxygenase-like lactoylglutathione lyase family enzyme